MDRELRTQRTRRRRLGSLPSAAGAIARLALARARETGIDVAPLLRRAGLTRRQLDDRSVRISVQSQIQFVELVASALEDSFLGFHLAREFDLREAGLLYYVMASSQSLADALRRAERYSTIVNEGICLRVRDARDFAVTFHYIGVERSSDRHQLEFWLTSLVRLCRQLTDHHLVPRRVGIAHQRMESAREFSAFLGRDIHFGADQDEVSFARTVRRLPVVSADPYLNELLIRYCEDALASRRTKCSTLRSDLEHAIALLLPHGPVRAGDVARTLGMSRRTLVRRLASERLTFSGLLTELRVSLARRYLAEGELAISQIAWLLGYQEISAFTHAFKRWTGMTPREARAGATRMRAAGARRHG
jgi:AraC-like DNA-binding protein